MYAFVMNKADNVATVLSSVAAGTEVTVKGEQNIERLVAIDDIPDKHKVAIQKMCEGEKVIKFGIVIGVSTRDVEVGRWVHLHNCRSEYDARSATLSVESGAATDRVYE